jgi:hypothetical protein
MHLSMTIGYGLGMRKKRNKEKLNLVLYLKDYNRWSNIDFLPIDDDTIDDVHNFSKYCRNVFDVIFNNHRELLEATLSGIEFSFLEFKEPVTTLTKKRFDI